MSLDDGPEVPPPDVTAVLPGLVGAGPRVAARQLEDS
jgi:hypothetical protein